MRTRTRARVLLVEFIAHDRFQTNRSSRYPFIRGLAQRLGAEVRWLVAGTAPERSASRFRVGLRDAVAERLVEAIRDFAPTRVVWNELLDEKLRRRLSNDLPDLPLPRTRLPDPSELRTAAALARRLGLTLRGSGLRGDELVLDAATPDYRCEVVDDEVANRPPPIEVVGGPLCAYRASVLDNPVYANIRRGRLKALRRRGLGCAFCGVHAEDSPVPRTPVVDLAFAQVLGAWQSGAAARRSGEFVMRPAGVFLRLGEFLERVLASDLPRSRFLFYCRLDEFLRSEKHLADLLPRLDEAGHAVDLFAMGAENLSPAENERLNKGLDADTIRRGIAALRALSERHPHSFRWRDHGDLSFIMFTPWTTLDDLRNNVKMADELGLAGDRLFLTSRLQLFGGSPLDLLARRDGLLARAFEDPLFAAYDSGCQKSEKQRERPWRFRSRAVSAIYGVCVRLGELPSCWDGDELLGRIRDFLRRLPAGERWPAWILDTLVAAAEEGGDRSSAELLDELVARAEREGRLVSRLARMTSEERANAVYDTLRTARERLFELARLLSEHTDQPLGGYFPVRVLGSSDGAGVGELELVLRRADSDVRLLLRPREGGRRGFLESRRYALWLQEGSDDDPESLRPICRQLLRAADRHLDPALLAVESQPL